MNDEPLIWTSKGNLPISDLEYRYGWHIGKDEIVFVEEYLLDGEVVKRAPHILKTEGLSIDGALSKLG